MFWFDSQTIEDSDAGDSQRNFRKNLLFCFQVWCWKARSGLSNNWGFRFAEICSSSFCAAEPGMTREGLC